MSVELREESGGRILIVTLSGQLSKDDYLKFAPQVERAAKIHGTIRVLFRMHDFHGWSMGALWEDVKFSVRHFSDIERLAVVGETKWEAAMSVFCKPFTSAEIRYFDQERVDEALAWIREGIQPHSLPPTKLREIEALDESADAVTLEEWQEWEAPGKPGRTFLVLPTGLHVDKVPGAKGRYDVTSTGEQLRSDDSNAP